MVNQFETPVIQAYYERLLEELSLSRELEVTAFGFGDTEVMADELGKLVKVGKKTATSSGFRLYEQAGETPPKVGDYSIVLDGGNHPLCAIKNTTVTVLPYAEITQTHAEKEGEGDLSLAYWQNVHKEFFSKYYEACGLEFTEDEALVFEEFAVVMI